MALSADQLERQKRHLLLKEIGGPGVQRLSGASVSIVGAGALGGPCAMYLAAAGVGQLTLFDPDVVDRSNLQRQIQYGEADVGRPKVEVLAERLRAMNPAIKVQHRPEPVEQGSTLPGDILIDATDNFPTRFVINRIAHETGRVLISGAVTQWSGQLSVFTSGFDAATPCYQCLVPELPPAGEACDDVGVVGPLTGEISSAMATETLKWIVQAGASLASRLRIYEALSGEIRTLKLRPNPDCQVCQS